MVSDIETEKENKVTDFSGIATHLIFPRLVMYEYILCISCPGLSMSETNFDQNFSSDRQIFLYL